MQADILVCMKPSVNLPTYCEQTLIKFENDWVHFSAHINMLQKSRIGKPWKLWSCEICDVILNFRLGPKPFF